MNEKEFARMLEHNCIAALQKGLSPTVMIGCLEVAKLNVDRIAVQAARDHQAGAIVKAMPGIIPKPNGRG